MWREIAEPSREDVARIRRVRRIELYADEDIEEEVVEVLREQKVNVWRARERGHRGKPDEWHAAFAFKHRRFLLTKNAKHFLDDRKIPFQRTHGIIAIEGDMGTGEPYAWAVVQVFDLIPFADIYQGAKIHVTATEMSVRAVEADGHVRTRRYKTQGGRSYEWVEPGAEGQR
jgi:hypothetical protein